MARSFGKFTIRDLFIILTVVAVLLMISLPMINEAREQARRSQCTGRLKQLTVAIANYESAHVRYPTAAPSCIDEAWHSTGIETGNTCQGPSWAINLATFMEDDSLADRALKCAIDHFQLADDCDKCGFGDSTPEYMLCPTAQSTKWPHESMMNGLEHLSKGNYAACMGGSTYLQSIDGNHYVEERLRTELGPVQYQKAKESRGIITVAMIPNWNERRRLSLHAGMSSLGIWKYGLSAGIPTKKISDGLSKTLLVSEVFGHDGFGPTSKDIRGVWASASMGASTYSHRTTPNSSTPDAVNGCAPNAPKHLPCRSIPASGPRAGDTHAAARSMHFRGVFAARADASVGFYANEIDSKVWKALATRAGGESDDSEDD